MWRKLVILMDLSILEQVLQQCLKSSFYLAQCLLGLLVGQGVTTATSRSQTILQILQDIVEQQMPKSTISMRRQVKRLPLIQLLPSLRMSDWGGWLSGWSARKVHI